MGAIAIYFMNQGVTALGFTAVVGMNPVSVMTVGMLGFPGILLLYGLSIYNMMTGMVIL